MKFEKYKRYVSANTFQRLTSFILLATVLTAAAILIKHLIPTNSLFVDRENERNMLLLVVTLVIAFLGMSIFIISYLDKNNEKNIEKRPTRKELEWQNSVDEFIQKNLSIEHVQKTVYEKIISNLSSYVIKEVEEKIEMRMSSDIISEKVGLILDPLENNVVRHIYRLQRNSVINLWIGIMATAIAVIVLGMATLSGNKFAFFGEFAYYFFPRLSFAISVQLFAFFFLRLYRNNFDDIKFFQNELTNLACKAAAIKSCIHLNLQTELADILKDFSKTERNSKLLSGETTAGIEKAKLDLQFDIHNIDNISRLLLFKQILGQENNSPNSNN